MRQAARFFSCLKRLPHRQQGFVDPISLITLGFIALALVVTVTIIKNPQSLDIRQWAKGTWNPDAALRQAERRAKYEGGDKWEVAEGTNEGKQCVGYDCQQIATGDLLSKKQKDTDNLIEQYANNPTDSDLQNQVKNTIGLDAFENLQEQITANQSESDPDPEPAAPEPSQQDVAEVFTPNTQEIQATNDAQIARQKAESELQKALTQINHATDNNDLDQAEVILDAYKNVLSQNQYQDAETKLINKRKQIEPTLQPPPTITETFTFTPEAPLPTRQDPTTTPTPLSPTATSFPSKTATPVAPESAPVPTTNTPFTNYSNLLKYTSGVTRILPPIKTPESEEIDPFQAKFITLSNYYSNPYNSQASQNAKTLCNQEAFDTGMQERNTSCSSNNLDQFAYNFLKQIDKNNPDLKILTDLETERTKNLKSYDLTQAFYRSDPLIVEQHKHNCLTRGISQGYLSQYDCNTDTGLNQYLIDQVKVVNGVDSENYLQVLKLVDTAKYINLKLNECRANNSACSTGAGTCAFNEQGQAQCIQPEEIVKTTDININPFSLRRGGVNCGGLSSDCCHIGDSCNQGLSCGSQSTCEYDQGWLNAQASIQIFKSLANKNTPLSPEQVQAIQLNNGFGLSSFQTNFYDLSSKLCNDSCDGVCHYSESNQGFSCTNKNDPDIRNAYLENYALNPDSNLRGTLGKPCVFKGTKMGCNEPLLTCSKNVCQLSQEASTMIFTNLEDSTLAESNINSYLLANQSVQALISSPEYAFDSQKCTSSTQGQAYSKNGSCWLCLNSSLKTIRHLKNNCHNASQAKRVLDAIPKFQLISEPAIAFNTITPYGQRTVYTCENKDLILIDKTCVDQITAAYNSDYKNGLAASRLIKDTQPQTFLGVIGNFIVDSMLAPVVKSLPLSSYYKASKIQAEQFLQTRQNLRNQYTEGHLSKTDADRLVNDLYQNLDPTVKTKTHTLAAKVFEYHPEKNLIDNYKEAVSDTLYHSLATTSLFTGAYTEGFAGSIGQIFGMEQNQGFLNYASTYADPNSTGWQKARSAALFGGEITFVLADVIDIVPVEQLVNPTTQNLIEPQRTMNLNTRQETLTQNYPLEAQRTTNLNTAKPSLAQRVAEVFLFRDITRLWRESEIDFQNESTSSVEPVSRFDVENYPQEAQRTTNLNTEERASNQNYPLEAKRTQNLNTGENLQEQANESTIFKNISDLFTGRKTIVLQPTQEGLSETERLRQTGLTQQQANEQNARNQQEAQQADEKLEFQKDVVELKKPNSLQYTNQEATTAEKEARIEAIANLPVPLTQRITQAISDSITNPIINFVGRVVVAFSKPEEPPTLVDLPKIFLSPSYQTWRLSEITLQDQLLIGNNSRFSGIYDSPSFRSTPQLETSGFGDILTDLPQNDTSDKPFSAIAENVVFGDALRLIDDTNKLHMQIVPTEIIIHWDGQPGRPSDWNTNTTFNGLSELILDTETGLWRSKDAHFGVDKNGVVQFLNMEGSTVQFSYGAKGYPHAINIEMAGSDFSVYNDGTTNVPQQEINNTVDLVVNLMKQYNIPLESIFGHSERDVSKDISYVLGEDGKPISITVKDSDNPMDRSKPDPGTNFMNYIRSEVEKRLTIPSETVAIKVDSNQTNQQNVSYQPSFINVSPTTIAKSAETKMRDCVQGYLGFYNACPGEYYAGQILQSTANISSTLGGNVRDETDLYWCTDLVFDSAEAVGIIFDYKIPGAKRLYDDMKQKNSVVLAENANFDSIQGNIQEGMTVFVSKPSNPGSEIYTVAHVGVLSDVVVTDSSVYVTLVQSNAGAKEVTYELDDKGRLVWDNDEGVPYYIRGFGDIQNYAQNQ